MRRAWRQRIVDHDGEQAGEGGIERWLALTDGLGLPRAYVASTAGLLPATRFAVGPMQPLAAADLARIEGELDGADGLLAIAAESEGSRQVGRWIVTSTRTAGVYWLERPVAARLVEDGRGAERDAEAAIEAPVGPFILRRGRYAASSVVVLVEGEPDPTPSPRAP